MIAILYTEKDAVELSDKIHNWLIVNRKDYTAQKWSDINKHEKEEKWFVKIPEDFEKSMKIEITIKEFIPISAAKAFLSTWRTEKSL